MKILCICPIGIGNYLLTYPAFALLRKSFPGAALHLLALRKAIADIAKNDPLWERIHTIDPVKERSVFRRLGFFSKLTKEKYDASLCFFPSNRLEYNLLPFFWRVRQRYAFDYPLKKTASCSFLNNHRLPIDPLLHDVDQNLRLVALFTGNGVPAGPPVFPVLYTSDDKAEAKKKLGRPDRAVSYIGIHPGSSGEHGMEAKRWDPLRFGELATRICGELKAEALIFGGPDEEPLKHRVASAIRAPYRIIGSCALSQTAALIGECAMFLCNDSGLMHMAACMGVPVAAVFGPTDERRNGPVGHSSIVIRKEMAGFPLWTAATVGVRAVHSGVDPQASLKALTVDDAWEKVLPWLGKIKTTIRHSAR
jgi:heptosyltransferase-2